MKNDKFGQQILDENDLCNFYLSNLEQIIKKALIEKDINFDLELNDIPILTKYTELNQSLEEFDNTCQNNWFIPDEYTNFDIAKFVLDQCKTDEELQRAGQELLLFQERNLFPLLRYLKYLVDTMRQNNIVWGVGRGSSVASFVLFLLGIHRINSLYYDLNIDEFLK